MASKLNFKEDCIELVEIDSEQGSAENVFHKFKKKNKIQSPTNLSSNLSASSSHSKISDAFIVKPLPKRRTLKPISRETSFCEENRERSSDIQSELSQKSDKYKEKLRSRFLTIKKDAESSIQKETSKASKKKKILEIDTVLESEESELKSRISKYEKSSSKEQNAYDFFCKDDIEEKEEEDKKSDSSECIENDNKQIVEDFLGIENFDEDLTEFMYPEQIYINDKDFLKTPSIFKKKKYQDDILRKTFEEDGIYVPTHSHIPKFLLNSLEERLLEEKNRNWFGRDGQLDILPDPRLNYFFRHYKSKISHNDFVDEFSLPALYIPAVNVINPSDNILELIIHNISFKHHPLFSAEHVVEQKLINLYDSYKKLISDRFLIIYMKKLDALRFAKKRVEETIKMSGECSEDQLKRFGKYFKEIKECRDRIYSEGSKEREIKKMILNVWKYLKNLRETQKYSSTSIKLCIRKEELDKDKEIQLWEKYIKEETVEILDERGSEYDIKMKKYKEQLEQWKNKEIEEKPVKPKKEFSEEQILEEVTERFNKFLKPPGEPNLNFELKFENEITKIVDNEKEILRRIEVNKTKIFIKILCNNREICKSKFISLNDKFVCNFNEQISIQLYKIPYYLILQVFARPKKLLKQFTIKVPSFKHLIQNVKSSKEKFVSNELYSFNHTAIGTGVEIKKVIKFEGFKDSDKLFLNGFLNYQLGWATEFLFENYDEESEFSIPTLFDAQNLEEWVEKYPDPQDPRNATLYDYMEQFEQKKEKKYFRLEPHMKALEFCSEEEIDENPRFKLLKLRYNKEPEFKDIVVPNRIKEIPSDIFQEYEKRKKNERTEDNLSKNFQEGDIDAQRKWAVKYLTQAENKIIQLSKIAERKLTVKDVLNEELIPSIGSLGLSFLNWFQPKRPLRPARRPVKQTQNPISFKDLNILINVIGAIQIPSRKEYLRSEQASSSKIQQMPIVPVRPFIIVTFRNVTARTTVAEGPNPIWNQELNLPLRSKNEIFTTLSLQKIKENIVFNLYDETVDDLVVDDRIKDVNIHQQIGCNWLGMFEIPFNTLLYNNRIEGTFKVNLPPILLGYERQSIKSFNTIGEPLTQKIDTFLTVFITLQPSVSNIQHEIQSELESSESEYIQEYIKNWENQFNSLQPKRRFSCLVATLNGETSCLTRFLQPIQPPELTENEVTELHCAKYVSLIPFRENGSSGLISDICLTPEQLLMLMMGSTKDHAILLTSFLMFLKKEVWLLLGYGLPSGFTSYVLVKEDGVVGENFFVYDVKSGLKYNVYDNVCPLQKVFCVINNENVWANVSCVDNINQTNFDFTKSSNWLPLFGKDISAPSNFQNIYPSYQEPSSVLLLEERIEKKLRKKIMNWRKFSRTSWNHYYNATFKKILVKMEKKSLEVENFCCSPEQFLEVQKLLTSYQIRGFALSFPYTSVESVVEFIKKCGIHINDNPNIEFSLSVYAKSYENNAVIIWLYAATLIRNR